jgi:hypothetical protein
VRNLRAAIRVNEESAFIAIMFFLHKRNRRAASRHPAEIPVQVTVQKSTRTLTGRIVDFSDGGLGLLLNEFVMFQTRVEVHWPDGGAYCEIRHCRNGADGEYLAGVKIQQLMPGTQSVLKTLGVA